MARLQLNKSSLAREGRNLRTYERFLPSLDLKRQQLMAKRAKAARTLAGTDREIESLRRQVGNRLPMLANLNVDLSDLARVTAVVVGSENLVGTQLPVLERVEVAIGAYAPMTKPHWVDDTAALLQSMLELRIRRQVEAQRLLLLEAAVKTITQRVNLFDKVLIPKTRANIKKIKIYLSDEDMAAVVRSKIAKNKHATARSV